MIKLTTQTRPGFRGLYYTRGTGAVIAENIVTGESRWFPRPSYSASDSQLVCDWLSGIDQPLTTMLDPTKDPLLNSARIPRRL